MKISVIIPVYNVEKYIKECLVSIAFQDYAGEIECIIVDDCGTDASMEIVEEFVNSCKCRTKFQVLHHSSNRGLSAARNTGMVAATGEYILFVDSDDALFQSCLSMLARPLEDARYDAVIGNYEVIASQNMSSRLKVKRDCVYRGKEILEAVCEGLIYTNAWNKLYNLQNLKKWNLLFYEGIIHEDDLWRFEFACVADSVYVNTQKTYYHRIRPGSIMTSNNIEQEVRMWPIIYQQATSFVRKRKFEGNFMVRRMLHLLFKRGFWTKHRLMPQYPPYKIYLEYRMSCRMRPYMFFFANRHSIKGLVWDAHYLFPPSLGYIVFRLIDICKFFSIFRKKSCQ